MFVAIPAFYFYLWDKNTSSLEDAETGQIVHGSNSSNTSTEAKQWWNSPLVLYLQTISSFGYTYFVICNSIRLCFTNNGSLIWYQWMWLASQFSRYRPRVDSFAFWLFWGGIWLSLPLASRMVLGAWRVTKLNHDKGPSCKARRTPHCIRVFFGLFVNCESMWY